MVLRIFILLILVFVPVLAVWWSRARREKRRRAWRERPFPDAWRSVLERNVALYSRLPESFRNELHGLIHIFLEEKHFEGAGGLVLTDEIRLTIAAQACMLLLNRPETLYSRLQSIVVYPHPFDVQTPVVFSPGHYMEDTETRLGESWHSGAVVLAWDHVLSSSRDLRDGHNVVFHEFAHQLDQESGDADGAPVLDRASHYVTWARILNRDYKDLCRRVAQGRPSFMDQYGAKSEAEFFAVATEFFFEQPALLRSQYPDLYNELKQFYRQDPEQYEEHG